MPHAFVELVRDVENKKFKADFRELNIPNGNIAVAWNESLMDRVPPALMKRINDTQAKIKSGELKIKRNV
jgi:basic membrane lipoprotein Med (substrate-binding protein (PBP1-ABC) superfamily)